METADLSRPTFWSETDAQTVVCGNPRRHNELASVKAAAAAIPELAGHIIVETSGSTGGAKFVCLSRSAILSSARAVNDHLQASGKDRWLCALPTFHVGGLGIYARGFAGGNEVHAYSADWHAGTFVKALEASRATLTSLVPTQVADLVSAELTSPPLLRAVIVGGGHLDETVEMQARQLGWPLLLSYGMTETCSQIATQRLDRLGIGEGPDGLQLLAHCQVRTTCDNRLAVRGESLMSGYLNIGEGGDASFEQPFDSEDWFVTQDLVAIEGEQLFYQGRVDRLVKILGELVDVDRVEETFRQRFTSGDRESVAVEAAVDGRRGFRLVPIVEHPIEMDSVDDAVRDYNMESGPLEKLEAAARVDRFPRSSLGKMQRAALRALARLR